jgi:hypothetical protein
VTGLIPADTNTLTPLDPASRELAVTAYLSAARDHLTHAMQMSGPETVAAIKAEIATAAEATKQLGLSKEIQTDALEMVRRAEFALAKAIRAGQESGQIHKQRENDRWRVLHHQLAKDSPEDYATRGELSGARSGEGIYALADGVSPEQFEDALEEARSEKNVSRNNVIRKIRSLKSDEMTPATRLEIIADLAATGHGSGHIAKAVGTNERYLRKLAREGGIEIPADEVTRKARRLDANRVVASTVLEASNVVSDSVLDAINFADLDRAEIGKWVSSLSTSIRALQTLRKNLEKELNRV